MTIVCLIPARGGSKGILKKNLKRIGRLSLVANRITEVGKILELDLVYVSTDDMEIRAEAIRYGASVIDRPLELGMDDTSTDAVIGHAVMKLGLSAEDILILLQPTSPFLKADRIYECLALLQADSELGSVITVREGHPFMWEESLQAKWEPLGHQRSYRARRQDLSRQGWETGGCYAIRIGAFLRENVRYPGPTSCVSVNLLESLDIDTSEDLELAREITRNA
jgi:CMP-N-acetylneuraminic acid synthetase